jgi:thiosulfate/3-mercaptopyruvate sulfurtransferase
LIGPKRSFAAHRSTLPGRAAIPAGEKGRRMAMDALVTTDWLADAIGADDLKVLDATAFALDPSRDPRAEYRAGHIPGAQFLDLSGLADPDSPLPGMLPSAERFADRIGALGVSERDRIVLYDNSPHRTAARAWWMFRTFGAKQVAILDGGLHAWHGAGLPLVPGDEPAVPVQFVANKDEGAVRDLAAILANIGTGQEQLLDARGAARFSGAEADPHGAAPGHVLGSRNLPYNQMLGEDGRFKDPAAIRAAFEGAGIDFDRPLVTTCGSGVTAAVLLFGAHLAGKDDVALYDGSWSEYGADPSTPKAQGPA